MRGLLKERRTDEAWQVMQVLARAGALPDRQCASRLVAQLAHRGVPSSLARAQQVLSALRTQERVDLLDRDALGLLAMASARSGAARYALNVLNLMFDLDMYPSVKVWSAVVSRLGKHVDDCPLALELFDDVCLRVRNLDAQSSLPDTGAFNAALNACATLGFLAKGEDLVRTLRAFSLEPDDITFNTLIKLYAKTHQLELLKSVPDLMVENGVQPNQATLNSLIAAYVGLGELREGEALLRRVQEGGSWWGAHLRADVRTYTTMMKGYVQKGRRSNAMRTLQAMQAEHDARTAPNEVTYTTAISSCVRLGMMDEACVVLQEMAKQNVPANVVTYNVLLKGYCSARRLREAHAVVADMEKAGVALDVVSYNTMVNGCIEVDDNAAALGYFKKMREAGISPSAVSYTTLMKAFGRNSQPKQVHLVFEEMRSDPSVKTDAVAWNVLLDSYCRNGRAADAKRMFLTMKQDRSAHSLSLPTCIPVSAQSMCRRSSSLRISTLPVPGW
jgi:pentatricopeptide repeat protein